MPRLMNVADFIATIDDEERASQPTPRQDIDLSPIIEQFGTWAVTEYGLECVTGFYAIERVRLWEDDWIDHMADKDWVNLRDFIRALRAAQRHFKSGI